MSKSDLDVLPLTPDASSLRLIELITRLRVKDVMTKDVITIGRNENMRRVKELMREKGITGVPVVDDGRLFGLISIDDIIQALDQGLMDDPAEAHMSTNVVVLAENMPLSLALSYFKRYRFRRFPVLNSANELVGVVTSRNINSAMLVEVVKELTAIEDHTDEHTIHSSEGMHFFKVYHVRKYDFDTAGRASTDIRKFLKERGVKARQIRRVAVASYELEMNQVAHSDGGTITCRIDHDDVEIVAQDVGPGIEDVESSLIEGVTTANAWIQSMGFGAGMGLPNTMRVSDEFDIKSTVGVGTRVRVLLKLKAEKTNENK